MNKLVKICDDIAKEYPYSTGEIFGLYNLISDCKKAINSKINIDQDKQIEELKKILEFSTVHAVNPASFIDFIYTDVVYNRMR